MSAIRQKLSLSAKPWPVFQARVESRRQTLSSVRASVLCDILLSPESRRNWVASRNMAALIFERVRRTLRRYRWLLACIGLLFASYSAAGFFLVPYLVRSAIGNYVLHDLRRHVAVAKLTFN